MKQLTPDHNTISNFRRDNEKAIKKVFRYTVSIAKQFDLIGGKLIAGDSTKLRAQNSKKNNFNEAKIERHIAYIDAKLEEYNNALAVADNDNKQIIADQIKKHQGRKDEYKNLQQQLDESGDSQISTSDPESRLLMTRNNISEVAYSVQTVVDAKHNLPIDYKVTNDNDTRALSGMLRRTKTILGTNEFTALYDKGYHTGCEIKAAVTAGIDIMVAIPGVSSFAPDDRYNMDQFRYDEHNDTYTCPGGKILTTNGTEYQKSTRTNSTYGVKHYNTNECQSCPAINMCTKRPRGRLIERSEFTPYIEQNKQNITSRPELYKKRQSIVEHPYGTIKRQWGFYYIITKKGMKRASADVGFMFIAYNLRRLMNIIDKNDLKKFLQELAFIFCQILASLKANIFKMRLYPYKLVSLPIGLPNALELPLKNLFLGRTEVLRRTAVVRHLKRAQFTCELYVTYKPKICRMNKSGPIIIIEDDIDDQDILADIFKELNYSNKLIFFGDSVKALEYLTDTDIEPFLVLSDINMPKLNGMELREKVHNNEDLRLKSIPYLFFSTSAEQKYVIDAYSRSIQGFFVKPSSYTKLKQIIVKIVEYWQECESPKYIKNAQQ